MSADATGGYGPRYGVEYGPAWRVNRRLPANTRIKPTDLFAFGLIPDFTGRLPVIALFHDLTRETLVRIMTEPKNSICGQFRDIFRSEGVELAVERRSSSKSRSSPSNTRPAPAARAPSSRN